MNANRRAFLYGAAAAGALPAFGAFAQSGPIRLGALLPLSGTSELIGRAIRIGTEIARDQINQAGGIDGRQLEIVYRDDKGDPSQSAAAAREHASSGVNLMLGTPLTACALAVMAIMPSLNGVLLNTGSATDQLTHESFNRHYFRVSDNNYMRCRATAKLTAERYPDAKKWSAVIVDLTVGHQAWAVFADGLKTFYKQAGKEIEIIDPILVKYGSPDYKTQIFRLLSQNVDGVFTTLLGSDAVTFFDQSKTLGLSDKVKVFIDNTTEIDLAKALKQRLPPHLWGISHWYYGAHKGNPVNDAFILEAQKRIGDPYPSSLSGVGHTSVLAYAEAIKAAKSTDTPAVINALEQIKINTVRGPYSYRKEDHQAIGQVHVIQLAPANNAQGWEVKDVATVPGADAVEPATPGVALKLGS